LPGILPTKSPAGTWEIENGKWNGARGNRQRGKEAIGKEVKSDFQPSTINHQPSTINHQPSTINHEPSTLNLDFFVFSLCCFLLCVLSG